MARAPALHAGGQGFDSLNLHQIVEKVNKVHKVIRLNLILIFDFINFLLYKLYNRIMWLSNKRPRALNYAVTKKGAKSGKKIENTIKQYKKLLERMAFEWETKWLTNAMVFVKTKLKKYSININKI